MKYFEFASVSDLLNAPDEGNSPAIEVPGDVLEDDWDSIVRASTARKDGVLMTTTKYSTGQRVALDTLKGALFLTAGVLYAWYGLRIFTGANQLVEKYLTPDAGVAIVGLLGEFLGLVLFYGAVYVLAIFVLWPIAKRLGIVAWDVLGRIGKSDN